MEVFRLRGDHDQWLLAVVLSRYVAYVQVDVGSQEPSCAFSKIVRGGSGAGQDSYPADWVTCVQGRQRGIGGFVAGLCGQAMALAQPEPGVFRSLSVGVRCHSSAKIPGRSVLSALTSQADQDESGQGRDDREGCGSGDGREGLLERGAGLLQ
jgi:hypothetical protein